MGLSELMKMAEEGLLPKYDGSCSGGMCKIPKPVKDAPAPADRKARLKVPAPVRDLHPVPSSARTQASDFEEVWNESGKV